MTLLDILIFLSIAVLIAVAAAIVSRVSNRRGMSKDYAEHIVMRRYPAGQVIGTRFARSGRRWVWEFDVLHGARIYRVSVDARTSTLSEAGPPKSGKSFVGRDVRMLGQKID